MFGMNPGSHKTLLRLLRDALEEWQHRDKLKREAVADKIVSHYHAAGYARALGFELKRPEIDGPAARVMTTNMQKIWRWLDDQSKSTNLMHPDFLLVVLDAMPLDLRLRCVTEWLRPVGLDVGLMAAEGQEACHAELVAAAAKEAGEGVGAFALLGARAGHERLLRSKVELEEGIASFEAALRYVNSQLLGQGDAK